MNLGSCLIHHLGFKVICSVTAGLGLHCTFSLIKSVLSRILRAVLCLWGLHIDCVEIGCGFNHLVVDSLFSIKRLVGLLRSSESPGPGSDSVISIIETQPKLTEP